MNKYDNQFAERMKSNYPPGTRIELIQLTDPYTSLSPGTRGTVLAIDDLGTVHPAWDNGRSIGLIPGEDSFRKLTQSEVEDEKHQKKDNVFVNRVNNEVIPKIDFNQMKDAYGKCIRAVPNYNFTDFAFGCKTRGAQHFYIHLFYVESFCSWYFRIFLYFSLGRFLHIK